MVVIEYPNADAILSWAKIVSGYENLSKFLPRINEEWATLLESDFRLCEMHPDGQDIARSASRLFYKIIKNHHFFDGNKRSAVLCVYLFLYWNDWDFDMPWSDLYILAKTVAERNEKSEEVINWIASRMIFIQREDE